MVRLDYHYVTGPWSLFGDLRLLFRTVPILLSVAERVLSHRAAGTNRDERLVFGVDFFLGDIHGAAQAVVARARSGEGGYACFGNVHVLVTCQEDESP